MTDRKICVVTGTRAEYGLLTPLLHAIDAHPEMTLQLVVTGTHLSKKFGHTVDAIHADGFTIAAEVPMNVDVDGRAAIGAAMGDCLDGISHAIKKLEPDLFVILGDRYEMLAAAAAATVMAVPIAHLHGGELTMGAMDDAMRHAITKLSHLHFVAAEPYRRRVLQMGEAPENVHVVGAIGLDNIAAVGEMTRDELGQEIGIDLSGPFVIVTYHPLTIGADDNGLEAMLDVLAARGDLGVVITGVNADPGRDAISRRLQDFRNAHPARTKLVESLGQRRYLNAVREAAAVVGNSSSGIIEAPALGTPTVNIGPRQEGRLRSESVFDCAPARDAVAQALDAALAWRVASDAPPPAYGFPGATAKIMATLAETEDFLQLLHKRFHDEPTTEGGINT